MRDAINSPAWGILDDWRSGVDRRSVVVRRSQSGYLLMAECYHRGRVFDESVFCPVASRLEECARTLVAAIEKKRRGFASAEVERLRTELAEAERAELEAASSVERAAHDSERDTRASEQPAAE